jgi:hypothetical protein
MDKKIAVVQHWLTLGSLKLSASACDVPLDTVRKWKQSPWWAELVADFRTAEDLVLSAKLKRIVESAADATLDRVENGDFVWDQKTSQMVRKPASLRDLHRVTVDSIAKRQMIRDSEEKTREVAQVTVNEHLVMLAKEMAKWNKANEKQPIVLEEIDDAVYAEREEGLQTGTSVGTQEEAGEGEGESGEEYGEEDDGGPRSGSEG